MSIQQGESTIASVPAVPAVAGFRNSGSLTRWLVILLWVNICFAAISGASGLIDVKLWLDFQAGIELTNEQADIHELRQQIIATLYFLENIPLVVVFCIWIYRANYNVRQLGAADMQFSPGWAVGWYFVPIMNLWKPYQVMKEIWQASANPARWQDEPRGSILPLWWTFFLLSAAVSIVTIRFSMSAEAAPEMIAFGSVSVAGDVIEIGSSLIALVLVRQIYRMQMTHRLSAAFG
jgi:hypothetical protein